MNKEKTNGKLNGLSLFTGYAGIDLALSEYVRPVLYCEIEQYPQAIILSRMDDGSIPFAPIWNDVTTLNGSQFKGLVDIVYGGFPCQNISSAGKGEGLAGKQSGLFYEVLRICEEASPLFIFLENVAAIRTNGSIEVQEALASIGYESRWGVISASEVGAIHGRERWFCLSTKRDVANAISVGAQVQTKGKLSRLELLGGNGENGPTTSDSSSENDGISFAIESEGQVQQFGIGTIERIRERVWPTESPICGANDVVANRVDRIKALGNGVCPSQVKKAFEILMGITA